jgi:hypothetical protein
VKLRRLIQLIFVVLSMAAGLTAGVSSAEIYGIVERVSFEPNEKSPERIKVWGAFALSHADINGRYISRVDLPRRGYLYFKLPPAAPAQQAARKEWANLKAVAGTGQALTFTLTVPQPSGLAKGSERGRAISLSQLSALQLEEKLTVYQDDDWPAVPVAYTMVTGSTIIRSQARHAALIAKLKQALQR